MKEIEDIFGWLRDNVEKYLYMSSDYNFVGYNFVGDDEPAIRTDDLINDLRKWCYENSHDANKTKALDIMSELIVFARKFPVFSVDFYISAGNNEIECYLGKHADKEDWNGNPLNDEEIESNVKKKIEDFRNSGDYDLNGTSKLKIRKTLSLPDIRYDTIYDIVCGVSTDLPVGYTYLGNVKLSDYGQMQSF